LFLGGIGAGVGKNGPSGNITVLSLSGQGVDKQWGQVENVLQKKERPDPRIWVNVVSSVRRSGKQEVFIKVGRS